MFDDLLITRSNVQETYSIVSLIVNNWPFLPLYRVTDNGHILRKRGFTKKYIYQRFSYSHLTGPSARSALEIVSHVLSKTGSGEGISI